MKSRALFTTVFAALVAASIGHAEPQLGDADFPKPSPSARHDAKVVAVRAGGYDLAVIGDSITHTLDHFGGNYTALEAVWDKYLAPHHAINLGHNGYRTENILWNLQNGELDFPTSPKLFQILIGTNNADDRNFPTVHTAEQILAGTKAIVDLIRQRHPTSKILILRIFPRGGDTDQATASWSFHGSAQCIDTCRRAGELTQGLADNEHVFWLDLSSVFLNATGSINSARLWDLLHPGGSNLVDPGAYGGGEAWVRAVEPTLAMLMGDPSVIPALSAPSRVSGISNGSPIELNVKVSNLAPASAYHVTAVSFSGANASAFSGASNSFPLAVPAAASSDVIVDFTPIAGGMATATMTLTTDDPNGPPLTVELVVTGGPILQFGFDATSGAVATPITDDSGANHPATNLLYGTATYTTDIPSAAVTQNVTGVAAVNLGPVSNATISTMPGSSIATAAQIWAAGGLTMEVWVKNPASANGGVATALSFGDMYVLGMNGDRIGFISGANGSLTTWSTNQYVAGDWNHLAAVLVPTAADCKSYHISSYLNGVLIGSGATTFPWFLNRATVIGGHTSLSTGADFDGLVYEPRVSLGALTVRQFTVATGLRRIPGTVTAQSNGSASQLTITVSNTPWRAYHVTGLAYSGADAAAFTHAASTPLTIPAGGSGDIVVDFMPSHGSGTYTATLTLTTDDPEHPTMTVNMTVEVTFPVASPIKVTATRLIGPTRMRIDFEGAANTAYQLKSSPNLNTSIFTEPVTVAVDGLTTNDIGIGRGLGFVEFYISVPGRMFYQIQNP